MTEDSARLNGQVNPNRASTSWWFEYGRTTEHGSETVHRQAGSGAVNVPVSEFISGLSPNQVYHYRLCVSARGLTGCGQRATFTTRPSAARLPAGFQQSTVISGLASPTAVRFSPDGRVFVAEKSGLIKVFSSLSDTTPEVFADLRTNVHNYWDRGLLGFDLAPSFPADPYVYVLYTRDATIGGVAPLWGNPGWTGDACPNPPGPLADGCVASGRLSRLRAVGNSAAGSEQVLVDGWCQHYPSHSLGSVDFGADGALYASGGDAAHQNSIDYGQLGGNVCGDPSGQGGALRSQDLSAAGDPAGLSGTIIRVVPSSGAALPNNPLAGSADVNARRIVGYGLRNPFRFTVRPGTNELFIGDVGMTAFDELNRLTNPLGQVENFGWPCYEGPARMAAFDAVNLPICETLYGQSGAVVNPYFSYAWARPVAGESCPSGNTSTSGLAFAPGDGPYASRFDGGLFLADYSRNCIWFMPSRSDGTPDPARIEPFVQGASAPVDLQIGPGGDLFYVDFTGGTIRRIRYFEGNQPPIAKGTASPRRGEPPLHVAFDGRQSSDPEGGSLSYAWDLDGDGQYDDSNSSTPSFTYTTPGRHTASVRATDGSGAQDIAEIDIEVGPPSVQITAPTPSATWRAQGRLAFTGYATDAQDGAIPASAMSWTLVLLHCPGDCHEHVVETVQGVADGAFDTPDHEYPSFLELRLTADDSDGLRSTESLQLNPQTTTVTLRSVPSGASLGLNQAQAATPFSRTVILGSTATLIAPSPQTVGGTGQWSWSSWSDAGARVHQVTVNAATTYTATFSGP